MKSVDLLSKSTRCYQEFICFLRNVGSIYSESFNSAQLSFADGTYLRIYDRKEGNHSEMYEIPEHVKASGYIYSYLIESRNKVMFCEIVKNIPSDFDVLIMDASGSIYKPSELDPDQLIM